jgi:hypothetical protein
VPSFLAWHRNEETGGSGNDLQIAHDETIVEHDRDVCFQLLLVDGKNFNFRDFHLAYFPN